MTTRRAFLASFAIAPLAVRAAGEPRMKRLAIFAGGAREESLAYHASYMEPLFREFGWVEGRNLEIVWFFGENKGERFGEIARKIVDAKPDVIATASTWRTRALQEATRAIPIVTTVGDPVGSGFAKGLGRPGGNITGLSLGTRENHEKQVDILRVALPRLQAVALVAQRKAPTSGEFTTQLLEAFGRGRVAAKAHRIETMEEWRAVLQSLPKGGRGAAYLQTELAPLANEAVFRAAAEHGIPTMANSDEGVVAGAMISYELYHGDPNRRTIVLLDRLLRGADPATIPFEGPDRSRLTVNLRTAKATGISLPSEFLLRADRVIE